MFSHLDVKLILKLLNAGLGLPCSDLGEISAIPFAIRPVPFCDQLYFQVCQLLTHRSHECFRNLVQRGQICPLVASGFIRTRQLTAVLSGGISLLIESGLDRFWPMAAIILAIGRVRMRPLAESG